MYKLTYDELTGKVNGVSKTMGSLVMFIPLAEDNSDYRDFLAWNKEQKPPLDLNSTIEIIKPVTRDLAKEIDILKSEIEALKKK